MTFFFLFPIQILKRKNFVYVQIRHNLYFYEKLFVVDFFCLSDYCYLKFILNFLDFNNNIILSEQTFSLIYNIAVICVLLVFDRRLFLVITVKCNARITPG